LNNLAALYRDQGQYDKAAQHYRQALSILENIGEPNDRNLASISSDLAFTYTKQKKFSEAKPLFDKALEIQQGQDGDQSDLAETLDYLAEWNREQGARDSGKYAEAERLYQQALEKRRNAQEQHHPKVADTLHGLALLYYQQGRYGEAEQHFKEALPILENSPCLNPLERADVLESYAALLRKTGRAAEAEEKEKLAKTIREQHEKENRR
jgi:tetratricopeptide (TPR) repeat protein